MLVSRMHPHWVGCGHTLEAGVVGAYDSAIGNFVYDVTTHSLNIKPSLEKYQSQPHCRHAATTSSHSVSLTEDKKLKDNGKRREAKVIVYAAGTVNPYLTIDAATAIRCAENEEKKNKSSASELLIGGFKPSSWSTGAGSPVRKNGS
ncbi:hypothetical protein Tco_0687552 [Tanacetum coccineum]